MWKSEKVKLTCSFVCGCPYCQAIKIPPDLTGESLGGCLCGRNGPRVCASFVILTLTLKRFLCVSDAN